MHVVILYSESMQLHREDQLDTLQQVHEVTEILKAMAYTTQAIAFADCLATTEKELLRSQPDCVINLVESIKGKDKNLHVASSVLEFLNIPYTGCPSYVLALLSSKVRHKKCCNTINC